MRRLLHELLESLRIALAQIRANKTRSALTALGVVIGIVSVTLMGTAILGIDAGVNRSLAGFGDDVLYVTKWPWREVDDWWTYRNRPRLKTEYARQINDWIAAHPEGPLRVAVPVADTAGTIIRGDLRLNNIYTLGTTPDLARISRADMKEGRFFNEVESRGGRNVIVVGFDVADALFPNESPLGKTVRIRTQQYTIIGVTTRQGSFLGLFSWDSMVIMPLNAFRRNFWVGNNVQIRVQADGARMDEAREELRGLMRRIRQIPLEKRDDFEINEQKVIREQLDPIKRGIALAGLAITGLALFVGAIGIMNITYVSVKERTKEIGTRKALGARRRTILLQFLIEAVSISLAGGIAGLLFAWLCTLVTGFLVPSFPPVFSFGLLVTGLAVSIVAGVVSGFAPAWSASKLDPVVALRYE
ncbi:ABC transporter permease [Termitidicoccus mucosus]|uniref:ABC transporter n=1 Tax=Termitidicoccus mucosus TaxID=1184151 RepID=A0A178ICG9_9BACT|nr:ABC transporter [Opitutaceae bacterium TSB47]